MLTDDQKWMAVVACDIAMDGQFFYGLNTTGVFCRPSCKSNPPIKENMVYFDTAQQALDSGLRPCKRCRPDLLKYSPQSELALTVKAICEQRFSDPASLTEELAGLGISRSRLMHIFQMECGKTLVGYVNDLRVDHAQKMLIHTDESVLEIAQQSGFESQSSFYVQFRRATGITPARYRRLHTTDVVKSLQ